MNNGAKENPFSGPQIQRSRFDRADMSGTDFNGVNLDEAKFFAVMTKAKFTDTNLSEAGFDDVNLANARFNNVNLSGTTITNANLSQLKISDATLANSDIQNVDLTGTRINGILVTDLLKFMKNQNSPEAKTDLDKNRNQSLVPLLVAIIERYP